MTRDSAKPEYFLLRPEVEKAYGYTHAKLLEAAAYRNTFYKDRFPTGTWLEVRGLALPEFMIEIELEAHQARP